MNNVKEYDVVIVGAGIAGLHAAHCLQKTYGKKVIVLEAKGISFLKVDQLDIY